MINAIKKIKNETIYKILVIVIFIVITIITGQHHEHWLDEAQSFLIARESSSFAEIIHYVKFEGTLPLWCLCIKLFLICGGNYETFYILPIIFSVIGLILLEFKIKAPLYLKLLLPFTYYILYQYTIVARPYCMVFPALMLVCVYWETKFEKPIGYCISLLWLSSICSYTLLMAGSLLLVDICEVLYGFIHERATERFFSKASLKSFGKYLKTNYKKVITICVIIIILFLNLLLLIPDKNCNETRIICEQFFMIFYQATIGNLNSRDGLISAIICGHLFLFILCIAHLKENDCKKKMLYTFIIIYPVLLENMAIRSYLWHIGLVWFAIIMALIVNNMVEKNKIVKCLLIFICSVQIVQTFVTVKFDIKEPYTAGKETAEYLKQTNYQEKTIYGIGSNVVSILPYFKENIFDNLNQDNKKAIWLWRDDSGYLTDEEMMENMADVYVFTAATFSQHRALSSHLRNNGYIPVKVFNGIIYTKSYENSIDSFIIFEKRNLKPVEEE